MGYRLRQVPQNVLIFSTILTTTDMENTSKDQIIRIHRLQREYFQSGETLDIRFRKEMLRKFLA